MFGSCSSSPATCATSARSTTLDAGDRSARKAAGLQAGDTARRRSTARAITDVGRRFAELVDPASDTATSATTCAIVVQRGDQRRSTTTSSSHERRRRQARSAVVAGIAPHRARAAARARRRRSRMAPRRGRHASGARRCSALGQHLLARRASANYFHVLAGDDKARSADAVAAVRVAGRVRAASRPTRSRRAGSRCVGLLIVINMFVGLFNLVPLLPFDGGHIAIATYEKIASTVRRRRVQVDVAKLMPVAVAVRGRARCSSSCRACSSTSRTRSRTRSDRR